MIDEQPDERTAFQEALKSWSGPDDEMNQYHADEGALYWLWGQATKWASGTKREVVEEKELIKIADAATTYCSYSEKKQLMMDICRHLLEHFDIRRRS